MSYDMLVAYSPFIFLLLILIGGEIWMRTTPGAGEAMVAVVKELAPDCPYEPSIVARRADGDNPACTCAKNCVELNMTYLDYQTPWLGLGTHECWCKTNNSTRRIR